MATDHTSIKMAMDHKMATDHTYMHKNGHGTQNGNGSYMLRDTKWQRDIHAIGSRASKLSSAEVVESER